MKKKGVNHLLKLGENYPNLKILEKKRDEEKDPAS